VGLTGTDPTSPAGGLGSPSSDPERRSRRARFRDDRRDGVRPPADRLPPTLARYAAVVSPWSPNRSPGRRARRPAGTGSEARASCRPSPTTCGPR
jgi:hypothetical protein